MCCRRRIADIEDQKDPSGTAYIHPTLIAVDITIFIGLSVTLGHALIDTGAQHGVVGIELFKHLYDFLNQHGLKPRKIPTL